MTTRASLKAVESESDAALRKELSIRGTTYVLVEVDGETYDECVESADTGEKDTFGNRVFDNAVLLKALLPKTLVSPPLSVKDINAKPIGVRRELLTAVSEMYFPPLEGDLKRMATSLTAAGYKVAEPKESAGKG